MCGWRPTKWEGGFFLSIQPKTPTYPLSTQRRAETSRRDAAQVLGAHRIPVTSTDTLRSPLYACSATNALLFFMRHNLRRAASARVHSTV